ncbi:YfcC family protein [Bacillus cereus]|uniref:YfcC family protein n=1 Tax=Bacillus cereus TaxID=1396 RepID=UPI000BF2D5A8|nr:YfcC family protein [Bacillus cereus]PER61431.1 C4-dicarboxylate ABC transporter permease [Bacillus cereus]PFC59045.1 C4-dicarboxylate ABC transporter permease [Bacillus cereus]PFI06805.1 C4-dicarboxylate ABC transporter permease [Bacillus cereus]PFJ23608.1 C4-dicarboxylate ABC transporter permease [Bacillus cereus]PGL43561.1 C4-dicarboxylate ABC transporter permease [Bacillus cereus]
MSQVSEKAVSFEPEEKKERKEWKINVFAMLLVLLVIAAVITHILPAGKYEQIEKNGYTTVDPNSFKWIESTPLGFFDTVKSIPTGMVEAANIIFFILIIGGFFGVLKASGTVEALVSTMAKKLANREKLMIPIIMLFFALGGSLMGMAEEALVYVPLFIPLALAVGFDTITGTAMVLVGASVGFTTAIMNPFTVGLAQGIAGLPMYSGMGFRLVLFVVIYVIAVTFVYRHAMKVKRDPASGIYGKFDTNKQDSLLTAKVGLTKRHKWILTAFLINYIILVFGVIKYEWYIKEIAALFIILTIIIAILGKISLDDTVESFTQGSASLIGGALIIGVSRAILVVLNQGHIIDPLLYQVSEGMEHISPFLSVVGMYNFQVAIHFILASGSGHAMLTMPIMAPLADLLDITRQTAVLSFSFADGIGNIIFPTGGTLMAGLAIAGISWTRWARWILPLILIEYLIGLIAVIIAHLIGYGPS